MPKRAAITMKRCYYYEAQDRFEIQRKNLSGGKPTSEPLRMDSIIDMLRYDLAFISTKQPNVLAFPVFKTKHGDLGGRVTQGRWDSFGVRILKMIDLHYSEQVTAKPEEWGTYRHPLDARGIIDYARLERVSFAEFLRRINEDPFYA